MRKIGIFHALKVGVTTAQAKYDRIVQHTRRGWQLIQSWDVATGADAEKIEQSILAWWRTTLGAPQAVLPADMPKGGWTETAALAYVNLDETVARIQSEVDRVGDQLST